MNLSGLCSYVGDLWPFRVWLMTMKKAHFFWGWSAWSCAAEQETRPSTSLLRPNTSRARQYHQTPTAASHCSKHVGNVIKSWIRETLFIRELQIRERDSSYSIHQSLKHHQWNKDENLQLSPSLHWSSAFTDEQTNDQTLNYLWQIFDPFLYFSWKPGKTYICKL